MTSGRRKTVKRVAAVASGMVLVGMVWSGVASAQVAQSAPAPNQVSVLPSVSSTASTSSTDSTSSTSATSSTSSTGSVLPSVLPSTSSSVLPSVFSTLPSVLSVSGSTASTSSTSSTSGANTVIQYSPYPVPVFGDYGHRYYGKYYDHGCGCDRYAAPTYTPANVVATQVASVPKGGVDTGDGSFQ